MLVDQSPSDESGNIKEMEEIIESIQIELKTLRENEVQKDEAMDRKENSIADLKKEVSFNNSDILA